MPATQTERLQLAISALRDVTADLEEALSWQPGVDLPDPAALPLMQQLAQDALGLVFLLDEAGSQENGEALADIERTLPALFTDILDPGTLPAAGR